MFEKFKKYCINRDASIFSALEKMDASNVKLLVVLNNNSTFHSLISIGDIQRAIIKDADLKAPLNDFLREDIKVAIRGEDFGEIRKRMQERRNEFMPVIDSMNNLVDIIFWKDLFQEQQKKKALPKDIPVVIMAGGKGTRMLPLTHVLPKPLIPLNEKTIIEEIMDQFAAFGIMRFYITVNYKAKLIEDYLNNYTGVPYKMEFLREKKPLGTSGALTMLKNKVTGPLFVTNCDIIIEQELRDVYDYHASNKNALTLVAAIKNYHIPYGTIDISSNGMLNSINEKPDLNLFINSGIYILESLILDLIPEDEFFHITDLINKLIERGEKVGVFPVSEKSWTDIGSWTEYTAYQQKS